MTSTTTSQNAFLPLAFAMVTPTGARYKALVAALDQFVENTKEIEGDDGWDEDDAAVLLAAEEMLEVLNARECALAEEN